MIFSLLKSNLFTKISLILTVLLFSEISYAGSWAAVTSSPCPTLQQCRGSANQGSCRIDVSIQSQCGGLLVWIGGFTPQCPGGLTLIDNQCILPPDIALDNCAKEGTTCLLASNLDNLCVNDRYYEKRFGVDEKNVYTQNGSCNTENPAFSGDPVIYTDFTQLEPTILDSSASCFQDNFSTEICIEEGEITYNGNNLDFEALQQPETACSGQYGAFNCVPHGQGNTGCGNFNGEVACYTLDGTRIDNTSVDSPLNGGNRDGNINNDTLPPGELLAETPQERATRSRDDTALANAIGQALQDRGIGAGGGASGSNGEGEGQGEGEGEGEEEGAGECDPTAANYLECLTPESTALPDHKTNDVASVEEANTKFFAAMNGTPLIASFAAFKNIIPQGGGSCSPLTMDLSGTIIGKVLTSNFLCEIYPTLKPLMSPVFIIIWLLNGFRIFASA